MYQAFDETLVAERNKTRACGECNVCCVLPTVAAFNKPIREPCKHLCNNCTIYDNRPQECREYECAWLHGFFIEDDLRPNQCGLLIDIRTTQLGRHFNVTEVWHGARNSDIAKYAIALLANKFEIVTIGPEVGQVDSIISYNQDLLEQIKTSKFIVEKF